MPATWRASIGYLVRHPWQLFLSMLGIGIGVAVIVAVDLQIEKRRQKAAVFQPFQQYVERYVDWQRVGAPSVNNAWYQSVTASLTGGPLACPRANRGDQIGYSPSHVLLLKDID